MALPIKDTPILYGNDAKKFLDEMIKNKDKKITKSERLRMDENYKFILECDKTSIF